MSASVLIFFVQLFADEDASRLGFPCVIALRFVCLQHPHTSIWLVISGFIHVLFADESAGGAWNRSRMLGAMNACAALRVKIVSECGKFALQSRNRKIQIVVSLWATFFFALQHPVKKWALLLCFADPLSKVEIMPMQKEYNAGETIKCVADGNPPPKIFFTPEGEGEEGEGWTSLVIKEEWVGKKQEVM